MRRLTETFESVRNNMAIAWNRAMLWIFTRLNTLMTVAKEAADRVMEATMRAEMNITNNLGSTMNELPVIHPEHLKPVNPTNIVQ